MTRGEDRGRPPRIEQVEGERRRRRGSTLDLGGQLKLDVADASMLDTQNFVYRFVSDKNGRLSHLTLRDDYDFVDGAEVGEGTPDAQLEQGERRAESDNRVRRAVGNDQYGHPEYQYLLKKPRAYWQADYDEVVTARENEMRSRQVEGEFTADPRELAEQAYVARGNKIGRTGKPAGAPASYIP